MLCPNYLIPYQLKEMTMFSKQKHKILIWNIVLDRVVHFEEDWSLNIDEYRKPTHTDQYLFDSHHPGSNHNYTPQGRKQSHKNRRKGEGT